MAGSDIHVTGLRELNTFLDTFPPKFAANIVRGGLRVGAKTIATQAKLNAPVAQPNAENRRLYGGYAGALRDSVRVATRISGQTIMARVLAGGKSAKTKADVWYAHLIEFTGAIAHTITAKGKGVLYLFGVFRKSVPHPGFNAKPFMRPALDSKAQPAIIAAAEYMKKKLETKGGLDTSDVVIAGDE